MTLDELYDKLRKVQRLVAEGATEGERAAAANAEESLKDLLRERTYSDAPAIEYRFSIHDPWQRRLFLAICRHHGLEPFRYRRQKRQTVMLKVSQRFVDDVLWPEYEEMADLLHEYLDDVTTSVIEDVLGQKDEDASEIAGELP